MAPNGPPDDFNNQQTRHANVAGRQPPPQDPELPAVGQPEPSESLDSFDEETEPIAWYRRPVVLIIWGLSVLILIALIVYGIVQLVHDQGTSNTPSTTSTTTTGPTTTTTTPTTTTTTTPSTTTTTAEVVPPSEQPTRQPTQQQPSHRHHWPSWLPSSLPSLP